MKTKLLNSAKKKKKEKKIMGKCNCFNVIRDILKSLNISKRFDKRE